MGYDGRVPDQHNEWQAAAEAMMDESGLIPLLAAAECCYCGSLTYRAELVQWVPCPICGECSLISPSRREQLRGW